MRKPIVGETLYSLNVGNRCSRGREQKLTPVTVKNVARKYFTVDHDGYDVEFHLQDWQQKTEYCRDYKLYETEQSWADEKEAQEIINKIVEVFNYRGSVKNFSLEKLRKIMELIC
jgi:hypothetical protein